MVQQCNICRLVGVRQDKKRKLGCNGPDRSYDRPEREQTYRWVYYTIRWGEKNKAKGETARNRQGPKKTWKRRKTEGIIRKNDEVDRESQGSQIVANTKKRESDKKK